MQVPEDEVQQLCPRASQKAFLAEVKAAAAPAVAPAALPVPSHHFHEPSGATG